MGIAAAAIRRSTEWDAQALANTAWACAALAMRHAPLSTALSAAAIKKSAELKSQELSNTAWAFSTMEFRHWPLLESIAAESIPKITHFDSQGMSNPAWAFAQRCLAHMPLRDSIAAASLPLLSVANTQELANFAWSNWALILRNPKLLRPEVQNWCGACFHPVTGRMVGVEWDHMADCSTDEYASPYLFGPRAPLPTGPHREGEE